jgi:DNA-binding CsgD family transcriptional regulator
MTSDHSKSALRGRRNECVVLDRVLGDTRSGQSRAIVLSGEAGIGKSTLLDYVEEHASNCRVARTAGVESEMDLAYAGLHQLCVSMLDKVDRLPEPQRVALGTVFGLEPGPPPDQFLVGLAMLGLLAEVAEDRPVVCIVDDAQWLDDATARTLAFVARRLLAESIAFVFAVRDPAAPAALANLPQLRVEGLPEEDALALLDSVITVPLDARVRDRVVAETRGNPLALMELPRGLSPAEIELGFGLHDKMPIAGRIEQGFLRQLQQLPSDTRLLLLTASIEPLGDVPLLWRAAEHLSINVDAAAPAEETGLVAFRGRVRFRHPLVRSAVFRTAGTSDLRAAHDALAFATDLDLDPERHAWHRAYAAAEPDEEIVKELEQAAEHAQRRGALVTAAAFLERATELTHEPALRATRALMATAWKVFAAEYESGLELLATAELCPLDEYQRAWLLWLRASALSGLRRAYDCPQMLLEAAALLAPMDGLRAREAYVNALGTQMYVGRLRDKGMHDIATAACAAPASPVPSRPIDAMLDAFAIRFTDGYHAGLTPLRRAVDACIAEQDPGEQFLQWQWFAPPMAPEVWDDERWDRLTEHVVQLNRAAGGVATLPGALEYRAEFLLHAGDFASASALYTEVDAIQQMSGQRPHPHASLEFAAWQGDEARALEVIDAGMQVMADFENGRTVGLGDYAKAVLFNSLGRYEEALRAARRACEYDDLGLLGRYLLERVEAAARSGALDDAATALDELEQRTHAAGTDWALGSLARSRALLSDTASAETHYREALERLGATRMRAQLARAHLLYGEWLRREQRRVDAREHLHRAHEMLTDMGAGAFAERARRELVATGEKVRKRSADTRDALTPQEAEIARLAAEGESNPEIGSRLFISPRTVEYHLAKAFVKLGIKSRRDLRAALR